MSNTVGAFLVSPFLQFVDALGAPLSGGFLYSYLSGTGTWQPLYSEPDLAVGHQIGQPLQLDSLGRCAAWTADVALTLVVKKADGTVWWSQDNYRISAPSNAVNLTLPDWMTALIY
jgi:hypothetical protein